MYKCTILYKYIKQEMRQNYAVCGLGNQGKKKEDKAEWDDAKRGKNLPLTGLPFCLKNPNPCSTFFCIW